MTQVELYIVDFQVAGQYVAVVGQYVAPFGRDGVYARQLGLGARVPFVRLYNGRAEQFDENYHPKQYESYRYDSVSEKYMCLIILFSGHVK